MTGEKWLVTVDRRLYVMNCSWIQKTAWQRRGEERKQKMRRRGGGHWMENVIHHNAEDTDDTKHVCCRDEGQTQWWKCFCRQLRFLIMITKTKAIFDIPHGRRERRVDCRVTLQSNWGLSHFNRGSNAIVVSPLFASDYLGPNLDASIRERQPHPRLLSSPFVCSLITGAKHEA